jgi:hypothetical protein
VINDYQEELEREWDEALKKKFPVVIDKKVLAEISNKLGIGVRKSGSRKEFL